MKQLITKWRNTPRPVKSSFLFAFSTFIVYGISFFTIPVFTRIMSQSEYGLLATYGAWMSILEVFSLLGINSAGVLNVGLNEYKEHRAQYLSSILILTNLVTLIVFGVIFYIKNSFYSNFLLPNQLLILMFLHFWFHTALVFWLTQQRYEYKYRIPVLIVIASAIISQGIAIIAVLNSESELGMVKLWSEEIGGLLFSIPIYFYILIRGKTFFSLSIWKNVCFFAIPLIPHYLSQHIMGSADRIMLTELVSQSATGIYSLPFGIGIVTEVLWSAVNSSLVPFTFEHLNEKKYNDIDIVVRVLLLAYGIICFFVTLLAPEALMILAPSEYYGGIYAVPPLICVAYMHALYNVYANIEFYHKKSKNIATATFLATIANVALNIVLIPYWGYVGAAYATLLSNLILIYLHYHGYRKASSNRIYQDHLIAKITAFILFLCLFSNILYINSMIRYTTLLIILIIAWRKKRIIIDKMRIMKESS